MRKLTVCDAYPMPNGRQIMDDQEKLHACFFNNSKDERVTPSQRVTEEWRVTLKERTK